MSRRFVAVLLALIAVFAFASASCVTDADCPSSYCVNYHGPPPYECHACGDYCCITDADCKSKCGAGSYCNNYDGKHYPYWCHATSCHQDPTPDFLK